MSPSNALPQFSQGFLLSGKSVVFHTDEDGNFESPMLRGALVTLHLKQSNFQCQFAVPDVAELDVKDIVGTYGVVRSVENPF